MTPLSEEDVRRMREEHKPHKCDMDCKGWCPLKGTCPKCLAPHPCDAYRLLEEREALKQEIEDDLYSHNRLGDLLRRTCDALKGPHPDPLTLHSWHDLPEVATTLKARISELESAPKAEASMTAEDFVRDLEADIHMLTGREAGRSPLITKAFIGAIRERDLSIAAAARKEAEDGMRTRFPLLSAKWLDPACREACRSLTIEHSRQALAEALRDLIDEEGNEPTVEHEHFNAPGIRCPRCLIVKALTTHGQDR